MTKNKTRQFIFFALICTSLWCVTQAPVYALSIRELLGLESEENSKTEAENIEAKSVETDVPQQEKNKQNATQETSIKPVLKFNEVEKIVSVLNESQRKELLADETAFQKFIEQEAVNKSVLSAARVNNVDKNSKAVFLVERGSESILREFYINQLIISKIPKEFPTDEQVAEYYNNNKDKFVLDERVQVWQIFFPIDKDASKKDIELVKKQAETISTELKKGKTSFEVAAHQHSGHEASRYNGGYLGLVKVDELKEGIQKPLMALAENTISAPIKTEDGIHILKRGTVVPKQELALDQVNDQIKILLQTQIRKQLREEIFKQAGKTYPVDLDDKKIEEWRLKLRTLSTSNTLSSTQ